MSVKPPHGRPPLLPLNASRLWKPVPSVLTRKTVPPPLAPPNVVIPYRVEPPSVKLHKGCSVVLPLNESRLSKPLPSVLMLKTLPSP